MLSGQTGADSGVFLLDTLGGRLYGAPRKRRESGRQGEFRRVEAMKDPRPEALRDLDDRLARLRAETQPEERKPAIQEPASGLGMAFTISAHLVAGLAVGAGMGYVLDQWLDTAPLLLIVFFFLGAAAGMLNVYRTVTGMGDAVGYRPAGTSPGSGAQGESNREGEEGRGESP